MEGSTAKLNIDHLVHLGIHTQDQARKWKELFKKNPISKCFGCKNKIRITDPISKSLHLRYYSHRHVPEVHWIFNFQLNINDPEAVQQCIQYLKTASNAKKREHILPCCYQCWNIAVNINQDYNAENVDTYYRNFMVENPEYTNWALVSFNQCTNDEQKQAKITQYYEYISAWCSMINYCSYTEDGLKYCSRKYGTCIHTNEELLLQHQQEQAQKAQQPIQQLEQPIQQLEQPIQQLE